MGSFSDFISFEKHFASTSSEEKLEGIFKLFDNNNEGILRRHEVRQIIFSLYLIKQKEIKVKVIEDVVEKVMKTKKKSNFGYISLDDFVENAYNVTELKEILQ